MSRCGLDRGCGWSAAQAPLPSPPPASQGEGAPGLPSPAQRGKGRGWGPTRAARAGRPLLLLATLTACTQPPTPHHGPPAPLSSSGPIALPDLGVRLVLPDGWTRCQVTSDMRILPGEAEPVAFSKGTGPLPLLLVGQVPAATLGHRAPEAYPTDFVAQLQERFNQLGPPPDEMRTGPAEGLPTWLHAGRQLVARGRFPEAGNAAATATFVAAISEQGQVWVLLSFTANDQDRTDLAALVGSMKMVTAP